MCSRRCNIPIDMNDFVDIINFVKTHEKAHQLIWCDSNQVNELQKYLLCILCIIVDNTNLCIEIIEHSTALFFAELGDLLNINISMVDCSFQENLYTVFGIQLLIMFVDES